MSNPYSAFCDDFYINMRLGSQMALPHARETVLHFFETVQKQYPAMTRFRRGEGETSLEEDREKEDYRWLSLESRRLSSGHVNPDSVATWASARWNLIILTCSSDLTSPSPAIMTKLLPKHC